MKVPRIPAKGLLMMPFLLLMLCFCSNVWAQPAATAAGKSATPTKVSGIVTDEAGKPVAGVTVSVKNSKVSTVTDQNGAYSIAAPSANSVLVFSFVGKASQELSIAGGDKLDVSLVEVNNQLNDVVVIGYGTVKRKDLTGSVYSIKNADLVRTPTHNPIEAMQGRVPGVDITRTSGAAGSNSQIRVRGNRTLSGSNEPLFIIDGFQGGNIGDINPNDIESIEVLKDASATAIYGAQGANGVFIVTTKKGKAGKAIVSYDGFYGTNGYTQYPASRTGDDYIQLRREAYRTVGEWNSPADDQNLFTPDEWNAIQRGEWVNWFDEVSRNGQQQSHTVSVQGGNDKTKAFLSAGYYNEQGMYRFDDYKRYTVRLNLEQTLAKWAKVGLNSQLAFAEIDRRNDPLGQANQTSPIAKAYNDDGSINVFPIYGNPSILSPLTDERGDTVYKNHTNRTAIMANGFIELKPVKGLTFRSTFGTNLVFGLAGRYESTTALSQRDTRQTISQQSSGFTRNFNFDNVLTYQNSLGDHNFTVTAIQSYIQADYDSLGAQGFNQLLSSQLYYNLGATAPATRNIGSQYKGSNNLAFAGRINYDYKSRYFLSLTYRADGASRISTGPNKWSYFPSVAGAWKMSDEGFMQNVKFVNNLKLRASWGVTGNYGIAEYGTQSTLLAASNLGFGENPAQYYYYNQYVGNKNLEWERSATTNIGLDFGLFKNRLNGSVDLYNTTTTGLLYQRMLPRSSGSVSNGTMFTIYENIGETNNKGIEIAVNGDIIRNKNFNWNSTLTFTKNNEKLVKVVTDQNIIAGVNTETASLLVGHPLSSFYSYRKLGIWQTSEADKAKALLFGTTPFKPGDIKVQDLNGDGIIDPNNDRTYLGSTVPKFILGWQNNFSFYNFDLGIYMFVRYGQMVNATFLSRYNPSGTGNGPAQFDYWTPENPTNDFPRPTKGGQFINYAAYQSIPFVDGSFFKIKNISLGYTLPANAVSKIHAQRVRLYVTANNFFTQAKSHLLDNYDPERGGEEGNPLSRQIVAGLNLSF